MLCLMVFLSLISKKWTFLRDFVLAGGLEVLVVLLLEPNLYARGQVCEIFLSIIDSDQDRFDWFPFHPPEGVTGEDSPILEEVRGHLYRQLAGVYSHSFLDHLIANSCNYNHNYSSGGEGGDGSGEGGTRKENSFPGGSARCLQILVMA